MGTTIKDTWTKPRGRVEAREGGGFCCGWVEVWGEKADNCNSITIKIKKKMANTRSGWGEKAGLSLRGVGPGVFIEFSLHRDT